MPRRKPLRARLRTRRCKAKAKSTGEQCRRVQFGDVCCVHGGASGLTRRRVAAEVELGRAAKAGRSDDGERRHPWEVMADANHHNDVRMRADPSPENVEAAFRTSKAMVDTRSFESWSGGQLGGLTAADATTVLAALIGAVIDAAAMVLPVPVPEREALRLSWREWAADEGGKALGRLGRHEAVGELAAPPMPDPAPAPAPEREAVSVRLTASARPAPASASRDDDDVGVVDAVIVDEDAGIDDEDDEQLEADLAMLRKLVGRR
jgi:hypothetical protein